MVICFSATAWSSSQYHVIRFLFHRKKSVSLSCKELRFFWQVENGSLWLLICLIFKLAFFVFPIILKKITWGVAFCLRFSHNKLGHITTPFSQKIYLFPRVFPHLRSVPLLYFPLNHDLSWPEHLQNYTFWECRQGSMTN